MLLIKYLPKCPYFQKPLLPWKIPAYAPANQLTKNALSGITCSNNLSSSWSTLLYFWMSWKDWIMYPSHDRRNKHRRCRKSILSFSARLCRIFFIQRNVHQTFFSSAFVFKLLILVVLWRLIRAIKLLVKYILYFQN